MGRAGVKDAAGERLRSRFDGVHNLAQGLIPAAGSGVFLGLSAGYLLEKLILAPEYWLPATGLIAGLFIGQILGRLRDRRINSAQMSM